MKKIPTLFIRTFEGHTVKSISNQVTPGFEWVLRGEGVATVKIDGSCCAVIDGALYKRYDAKNGKKPPKGAIPCCDPDPVTGHWPHWVLCDALNPSDRWFFEAYKDATSGGFPILEDATYEAIGPHFQGNPYGLKTDMLIRHGMLPVSVERSFEGIRKYLRMHPMEGLVFWKDGQPQCKIKRTDFGFPWPVSNEG